MTCCKTYNFFGPPCTVGNTGLTSSQRSKRSPCSRDSGTLICHWKSNSFAIAASATTGSSSSRTRQSADQCMAAAIDQIHSDAVRTSQCPSRDAHLQLPINDRFDTGDTQRPVYRVGQKNVSCCTVIDISKARQ